MNNKPFTVLISVYHKDIPAYFDLALRSVTVEQTLRPNQVVIVEDGPVPVQMEEVINSVKAEVPGIDFTVLRRSENKGLAVSLNEGLRACKNEWIARMDSDDLSVPNRFEKQFTYLNSNPEVTVLGSAIAEFCEKPGDLSSVRHVGLSHEEIVGMAKKRTPFNHMTVIYLRDAVMSVGGYSEDFGKLEDYKLWVDILAKGYKVANLNDILVNVRVGNGFIERRSSKREIYDWDNLQKYLIQSGIINKKEALINKIYIRSFIYMPVWAKKIAYKYILRK